MDFNTFMAEAGIPLFVFVACLYAGLKLLIFKDISLVRGKDRPPVKDKEEFARRGGILILFFAASTLVMMGLLFVNVYVALAQIVVCTAVFAILWKKMSDTYGG